MKSNTEIPTNLANIRRRLQLPDIDFNFKPANVSAFPSHELTNVPEHMLSHNWRDLPHSNLAVSHLGEVYNKQTHSLCEIRQSPYNPSCFAAVVDSTELPNGKKRLHLRDVATLVAEHFLVSPVNYNYGLTNLDILNPYPTAYNLAFLPFDDTLKCGYSQDEAKMIIDWTLYDELSDNFEVIE